MKIVFLSTLYSSPEHPGRSPGNTRILRAMRKHCDVTLVVPIPYYPEPLVRKHPALHALATASTIERDVDGNDIFHPRTLHLPKVGRALYAGLFATSLLAPLRRLHAEHRFDAMLTAWAYPDGTGAVALGKALGIPTVVRVMGSDINDYAHKPWRRPQIKWAMQKADRVIAVSNHLKGEVEKLGAEPHKVVFVPTGVDRTRFSPRDRAEARRELGIDHDDPIVVIPGRLAPEKGVHFFLDALATLPGHVRGILVGDGPDRAKLEAQAQALGVEGRVTFAGFEPEARMPLYYSAADVACLASLEEGWPDALMEAFSCGCPVVASDVGGVPEIIALTGEGLTAEPGNPRSLAASLGRALETKIDRAALAEKMNQHTLDQTAERYVATLRDATR